MDDLTLIIILIFFWFTFYLFKGASQNPKENNENLALYSEKLADYLVEIESLINQEAYSEAKVLCDDIEKDISNAQLHYYLYLIHKGLGAPQDAQKSIRMALLIMDKDSDSYLYTLAEAIEITFQCGNLDEVIYCCELFKGQHSSGHEDLLSKVNTILEQCLDRAENRDKILEKFNHQSIELSDVLDQLIEQGAYSDAMPLLLECDDFSDLVHLEFVFRFFLVMGDAQAAELAYELYESNVKTHLVYQCMHSYSLGVKDEKLKKEVLSGYLKDFGQDHECREFFSSLVQS